MAASRIAERARESSASTQGSRIETDVFFELMGPERFGRVRGYGIGVTPTQLSAVSRFTQDARDGAGDASVLRLEAELTALRETRDSDRAEIAALRATRDADRSEMQAMRAQLEHLTSVMHMFMPSQVPDIFGTRRQDDDYSPADH